ncbi:hypothetical protein SteCoe_17475 [Stentor coeruleus]|uniref:Rab GDP dissociation inhibitor n=1 Tax=Stentor coeruleus TaxID=5963 RepID=A0A1R2BZ56_9CILI|nr:hypothetical protein SteCoe_17475 [Stentor coeruleus]
MDENYDVIILGTGIAESILSCLFSCDGKKILVLDQNSYYGSESPSVDLKLLHNMFYAGSTPRDKLPPSKEWCIDLIPKLILINKKFFKILQSLNRLNDFQIYKSVNHHYISQRNPQPSKKSEISPNQGFYLQKIPNTIETLGEYIVNQEENEKFKNFFYYIQNYKTSKQEALKIDPERSTFIDILKIFGLSESGIYNIICVFSLDKEQCETVIGDWALIKLQQQLNSPYLMPSFRLYPNYGLGNIIESCTRINAIFGSTTILSAEVDKVIFNDENKVIGVRTYHGIAQAPIVICNRSYAPKGKKGRLVKRIVRSICIIEDRDSGNYNDSGYIYIKGNHINRENSIQIIYLGASHCVSPEGYIVACCSTVVETDSPEKELQVAHDLLGNIVNQYVKLYEIYENDLTLSDSNLYVVNDFDEIPDLENTAEEIQKIYEIISKKSLFVDNI